MFDIHAQPPESAPEAPERVPRAAGRRGARGGPRSLNPWRLRAAGFTLLELLTVMTILALLATVGIVGYRRHTKAAKEAVLKEDLFQLNHALEQHKADKGRYPASIETLREQGYLRDIPADPMTGSKDTWVAEPEPPDPDNPDADAGIFRIRSGSTDVGENGIPYNEWSY